LNCSFISSPPYSNSYSQEDYPGTPASHPFIERVIGTTRRECLDQLIFCNKLDLQRKLDRFQDYYNEDRAHSSLNMNTTQMMAMENAGEKIIASVDDYRLQWSV
jgi:transposase InsO family protein